MSNFHFRQETNASSSDSDTKFSNITRPGGNSWHGERLDGTEKKDKVNKFYSQVLPKILKCILKIYFCKSLRILTKIGTCVKTYLYQTYSRLYGIVSKAW